MVGTSVRETPSRHFHRIFGRRKCYETNHGRARCCCNTRGRGGLHGDLVSPLHGSRGRATLRNPHSAWIPRLEGRLGGPRRRRPQRYSRHSGERRGDHCLSRRKDPLPRRRDHWPHRLELCPVGGKQQSLRPPPIFRGRRPHGFLPAVHGQGLKEVRRDRWLGIRVIRQGRQTEPCVSHENVLPVPPGCHGSRFHLHPLYTLIQTSQKR